MDDHALHQRAHDLFEADLFGERLRGGRHDLEVELVLQPLGRELGRLAARRRGGIAAKRRGLGIGAPLPVEAHRRCEAAIRRCGEIGSAIEGGSEFLGERLVMHEPRPGRRLGRLPIEVHGLARATGEAGDLGLQHQVLRGEGLGVEARPDFETRACLRHAAAFAGLRPDQARFGKRQEEAVIGRVDMGRCRPCHGFRLFEVGHSRLHAADEEGLQAGIVLDPEPGRDRGRLQLQIGDRVGEVAGTQRIRQIELRGEDELDVAVADLAGHRDAVDEFRPDAVERLADHQEVGRDVVAGIARHAEVAGCLSDPRAFAGVAERGLHRQRPGADLVERDEGRGALGLVAIALREFGSGHGIGGAAFIAAEIVRAEDAEPGEAIGRFRRRAIG